MPNGTGTGVGLVAIDYSQGSGQIVYELRHNVGDGYLAYNSELEAVTLAVEYAARTAKPGQQVHIYSDNQAGIYRLKSPSDNPGQSQQIRAIQAALIARDKGASIRLNWVPGHTEVAGNELADALAKEATKLVPPDLEETSFALIGPRIKQINSLEWKAYLGKQKRSQNPAAYSRTFKWKLNSKMQVPIGTKRVLASAFYELKLGHGYFKSYLHRLGRAANHACQCGKKETPEHLLLSCPELRESRRVLREKLSSTRLSLRLLLHTKEGIQETLNFINSTKIATRKWYLNRGVNAGSGEEEGMGES
jgi:ribonuclease HI